MNQGALSALQESHPTESDMATIHPLPGNAARKPARARKSSPKAKAVASTHPLNRLGPPAKAVLIAAGTLGLAAVAVALIGPRHLFRRAGDEREKLARDFQSWIGNFRT